MNHVFWSFFLTFLFLACTAGVTSSCRAQTELAPSTSEDVAIAFFKTAGVAPDYDKWAKGSKEYHVAPPVMAEDILFQEKQRLMRLYKAYDPDSSPVRIKTSVTAALKTSADAKGHEKNTLTLSFEKGEADYFPFSYQGYDIAVIPQKMSGILKQDISKEQAALLTNHFGDAKAGTAILFLELRPAKAYLNQPYSLDGKDQWMMLADAVSLTLRASNGTVLWTYGADWYVSPAKQQVRSLYKS